MFLRTTKLLIVLSIVLMFKFSIAQQNAERSISPGLIECYADPFLSVKDNLLPHTIETLINLIRKIENAPGLNQGITQLVVSILYRFRQDGIVRHKDVVASSVIIPYSASEFQLGKHNLLLKKLLPGTVGNFPNDTLSALERCTLHSMLSSSVDNRRRGDEGQVCSKLANYRSVRVPRSLKEPKTNSKDNQFVDIDMINKNKNKAKPETFGKMQVSQDDENEPDYEEYDSNIPRGHLDPVDSFTVNNNERSECPTENGVVQTLWGTISPGNVLNGIATGLQNQRVPLNLLLGSRRRSGQQNDKVDKVDNRYASTLAGDLAEVVLRQVVRDPRADNIVIGSPGAWNSTILPKWYFLSQREKYEMTDAEIRGGIDGLLIALKIREWQTKASNLQLSSVLDMYYSQKGIFDSGMRACDRKKFFNDMIKPEDLQQQTTLFSKLLQHYITTVTIQDEGFSKFSEIVTKKLFQYIPQSLNDLSCESTATNPNEIESEIATDLIVFVDTTWPFKEIQQLIGYVISKINLDAKKGSSITILDAKEANFITNTTSNASYAQSSWTLESHQRNPGFSLPKILLKLRNITGEFMKWEKDNSTAGGRSLVTIIVPYSSSISEADSDYAWDRLKSLREDAPDLRFIFFVQGSLNNFERFAVDKKKDLIAASIGGEPATVVKPIVARLKEMSRRIINPRCGPDFDGSDTGISQIKQCVAPGSVKYYRLMPNYFYSQNGNRKIRLETQGTLTTITVCTSRYKENPRSNTTIDKPEDLECTQTIQKPFELQLDNPCYGSYEIHNCDPFYFSVEASKDTAGEVTSDSDCKNPDEIPFILKAEHLTCHSGADRIFQSSLITIGFYFFVLSWRT